MNAKSRFTKDMIKFFLQYIILKNFETSQFGGYDIIVYITNEFNISLSSGTIYATLYSMERKNLLNGAFNKRNKRVYKVTSEGKLVLNSVIYDKSVENLIKGIFCNEGSCTNGKYSHSVTKGIFTSRLSYESEPRV